jgi:hypothetical protein
MGLCVPPIVARQRLGKNLPVVARQRLGRNATPVTNTHATIVVGRVFFNVARVVSRKVGDQFFPELLFTISIRVSHWQEGPNGMYMQAVFRLSINTQNPSLSYSNLLDYYNKCSRC